MKISGENIWGNHDIFFKLKTNPQLMCYALQIISPLLWIKFFGDEMERKVSEGFLAFVG